VALERRSFKEGEYLYAKNSVVVVHEFGKFTVQSGNFLLQMMGDVSVDSWVAEVFFEALLDVFTAQHDHNAYVFICPDDDVFVVVNKLTEG
jgi:hypothetical protein